MSLVGVRDFAGAADPAAAMRAAYLERKRRLEAAAYVPPPPPPGPEPEPVAPVDAISLYRNVVDTSDPVLDFSLACSLRVMPLRSRWSVVVTIVSEATGISRLDIESARRAAPVVYARMIALWLMRKCTPLSLPQIGKSCGGRDHTTVLHACRCVDSKMEVDEAYRLDVLRMRDRIMGEGLGA